MCRHVSIWGFQNLVCLSVPREKKSPKLSQYQSYISNWYINGKVFTSNTAWKPKNLIKKKKFEIDKIEFCPYPKKRNHPDFVDISPLLVPIWYINGKVFTSTAAWRPKNLNSFLKKIEIEFWLVLKSWNQHSSGSQHAPLWRRQGCIVVLLRVDI